MKNTLLIILLFLHTISFSQNITNMGGHNYKGIPNNLDTKEESIRLDLLKDISLLLPDGKNLQNFNPSLYNRSILSFITLQENSDVYLAFISEGADFKSSVGFYTFKGNPPSHPTQIYSPKVVFPNVTQGEGVLKQGNRVKLGNFEAGTSIGFFLIANGFKYGRMMQSGNDVFYTDSKYNPESNNDLKKHSILIYDEKSDQFILLFEDFNRESASDLDFNDAIFTISTNVSKAMKTEEALEIQKEKENQNSGKNQEKLISICHYTTGKKENPVQIQITESAWITHQKHGDSIGDCPAKINETKITKTVSTSTTSKTGIEGTYKAECVNEEISISISQSEIYVTPSNNRKQYTYKKVGPNTFQNDIGNSYHFINDSTVVWESNREIGRVNFYKIQSNSPNSGNKTKITICHYPPGNTNNPQTIEIPENEWPTHQKHGDSSETCETIFKDTEMGFAFSGLNINGNWKLERRPQTNVIRMTNEGIEVKVLNTTKWFLYKKAGDNFYKDDKGNIYTFESETRGVWKSGNGKVTIEMSKLKD